MSKSDFLTADLPDTKEEIARFLKEDPSGYLSAVDALGKMRGHRDDAQKRIDELISASNHREDRDAAADAMLAGKWSPGIRSSDIEAQMSDAYERKRVARRAMEKAELVAKDEGAKLSVKIAAKLAPRYRALAARIAAAAKTLREAITAEREFSRHLFDADVQLYGAWNPVDVLVTTESIDLWLENAKRDGNI